MVKFYNSLSPTTKLLIQSFIAVLGSVLAGVLTAVYQSFILSSQINLALLWNVAIVTFALLFGKAMHDWIPAHAQQLLQAANDEKAALQDALQRAQQISSAVIATQGKQVQSASSQAQIQPVIVQAAPLSPEHVQAISQQIALNLANMAGGPPVPTASVANPDAYVDPLKVSMKLPAYVPPTLDLAGSTAIQPQVTQVPFPVPARPSSAIMP